MRFLLSIFFCGLFVFRVHAQADYSRVTEAQRTSLFEKSGYVVNAKVTERGRFVRTEDGVFYGTITCEITESFKGDLKKRKSIIIDVVEFDDRGLGGKFTNDEEGIYRIGQNYVFFLRKIKKGDYPDAPEYEPVDDVNGIMYACDGLRKWLLARKL